MRIFPLIFCICSGIFRDDCVRDRAALLRAPWITLSIAEDVDRFWDVGALLANVFVFFLVGAALQIDAWRSEPAFTVACLVAIAVARVVVGGLLLLGPYPREWIAVVRVAGMRGGLCLALALALPASLPYRDAIIDATFAVALATLAAASLTIVPAIRRAARSTVAYPFRSPSGYASSP